MCVDSFLLSLLLLVCDLHILIVGGFFLNCLGLNAIILCLGRHIMVVFESLKYISQQVEFMWDKGLSFQVSTVNLK